MAKRIPYKDKPALIRDPAEWARSFGWINRKQADELRDALRGLLEVTDALAAPVEEGDEEWPQIVEARRVLAKRVHRSKPSVTTASPASLTNSR